MSNIVGRVRDSSTALAWAANDAEAHRSRVSVCVWWCVMVPMVARLQMNVHDVHLKKQLTLWACRYYRRGPTISNTFPAQHTTCTSWILKPRLTAGCQSGLTTGLTTVLNEQPLFVQPLVKPCCTTRFITGCIHDTTGWQPFWQQVVSCKRGFIVPWFHFWRPGGVKFNEF